MKAVAVLLSAFVVLTILFASISAFESTQRAKTETVTSSTTLTVVQPGTVTVNRTKTFTTSVTTTATHTSTRMTAANLCSEPYPQTNTSLSKLPNGTTIYTEKFPVLLLSPGTFGYFCIRYSNAFPSQPFDGNVRIWVFASSPSASTTGVTGAANVTTLSVHDNDTKTILYTLVAGVRADSCVTSPCFSLAKGTYGVATTTGFCGGLPFAVGYAASELSPANFSWLFQPTSCGSQLNSQVIGYGNMNVTMLSYVRKASG